MGRKKRNKIVFEKEIVTKEVAEKIVAEHETNEPTDHKPEKKYEPREFESEQEKVGTIKPKKKKKKKELQRETQNSEEQPAKTKKRKRDTTTTQNEETPAPAGNEETTGELNPTNPEIKREESIRAKKRKKHAELMQQQKSKAELALQQKCLNYLSQWKHNREEWKFEKLKQVWLQQNMFSSLKMPEELWEILVEYFSGSKGKARDAIVKDALKIIEEEDGTAEKTDEGDDDDIKLRRARDIIQNLQE